MMRAARLGRLFACLVPACLSTSSLPFTAQAAVLPGANLHVAADSSAADCPDDVTLAEKLRPRVRTNPAVGPLDIYIRIGAADLDYIATLEIRGRKEGVRTLRAKGPTCTNLEEALLISLLLILDAEPIQEQPPPYSSSGRMSAPLVPPTHPKRPSFSLSLGVAATHGLPSGWSAAAYLALLTKLESWTMSLGALRGLDQRIESSPGYVELGVSGVFSSLCRVTFRLGDVDISGCVFASIAALSAAGANFSENESQTRPLVLLGLGPELGWNVASSFTIVLSGDILWSPHREVFVVRNIGPIYETDRAIAWVGIDLRMRIW